MIFWVAPAGMLDAKQNDTDKPDGEEPARPNGDPKTNRMIHEHSAATCKSRHHLRQACCRVAGAQPHLRGRSSSLLGSARATLRLATLRLATHHTNHSG